MSSCLVTMAILLLTFLIQLSDHWFFIDRFALGSPGLAPFLLYWLFHAHGGHLAWNLAILLAVGRPLNTAIGDAAWTTLFALAVLVLGFLYVCLFSEAAIGCSLGTYALAGCASVVIPKQACADALHWLQVRHCLVVIGAWELVRLLSTGLHPALVAHAGALALGILVGICHRAARPRD